MATIRTRLKELRNGDVKWISLVDRAASRIPFRVLKRDKESAMAGIDLMGVFKRDKAKPEVAGVVVFAQKDATVAELVRKSIADAGFLTDRVRKSDDGETVVYAQHGNHPDEELALVRLSDQMLVTVKGLDEPTGLFSGIVQEHGFYPGFSMAMQAFHDTVQDIVAKSDSLSKDIQPVMDSFTDYMAMLSTLPPAIFQVDTVVCKISQEQKDKQEQVKKDTDDGTNKVLPGKNIHEPNLPGVQEVEAPGLQPNASGTVSEVKKDEKVEEKVDEKKDEKVPPGVTVVKEEVKKEEVKTPDVQQLLKDAISGMESRITDQFTSLTQKVEGVATTQVEHKKTLDEVVKKTDTLEGQVKSTVTAPPNDGDRPAGGDRETVKKVDDDPRTGNFDTAFLPGRGRLAGRR